jgi:hypothetical protein
LISGHGPVISKVDRYLKENRSKLETELSSQVRQDEVVRGWSQGGCAIFFSS